MSHITYDNIVVPYWPQTQSYIIGLFAWMFSVLIGPCVCPSGRGTAIGRPLTAEKTGTLTRFHRLAFLARQAAVSPAQSPLTHLHQSHPGCPSRRGGGARERAGSGRDQDLRTVVEGHEQPAVSLWCWNICTSERGTSCFCDSSTWQPRPPPWSFEGTDWLKQDSGPSPGRRPCWVFTFTVCFLFLSSVCQTADELQDVV